ncbi:hypothetical protein D3C87_1500530 [compost metagenome]
MRQDEVVHVAHVVFAAQAVFDMLIQTVQQDVGEELGRQVPDGQPAIFWRFTQSLVPGNQGQSGPVAAHLDIRPRVMEQDLGCEAAPPVLGDLPAHP